MSGLKVVSSPLGWRVSPIFREVSIVHTQWLNHNAICLLEESYCLMVVPRFVLFCVCVWHLCKIQIMIHVFRVVSPCLMMFQVVSLWSFLAQISPFIHTISTTHISTRSHLFIFDQMVWFIIIPSEFSNIMWYMIKITPLNSEFDPWVKQPGTSPSSPHSNCRPLCAWDLPGWCSLRGSSMGRPHFFGFNVIYWLVVEPPLWKIWKSVGIIIPNIWKPPTSFIWSETSKDWDFESREISWNWVSQNKKISPAKVGDCSAVPLDAARSDPPIPHGMVGICWTIWVWTWKCWVNIPNEIAIFHRDNDQQNQTGFRATQHFQTHPFRSWPWDPMGPLVNSSVTKNVVLRHAALALALEAFGAPQQASTELRREEQPAVEPWGYPGEPRGPAVGLLVWDEFFQVASTPQILPLHPQIHLLNDERSQGLLVPLEYNANSGPGLVILRILNLC